MQWGDLSFNDDPIGNFMGMKNNKKFNLLRKINSKRKPQHREVRSMKLSYLSNLYSMEPTG